MWLKNGAATYNNGFSNGCIAQRILRILYLQAFLSQENQYYLENHKE